MTPHSNHKGVFVMVARVQVVCVRGAGTDRPCVVCYNIATCLHALSVTRHDCRTTMYDENNKVNKLIPQLTSRVYSLNTGISALKSPTTEVMTACRFRPRKRHAIHMLYTSTIATSLN